MDTIQVQKTIGRREYRVTLKRANLTAQIEWRAAGDDMPWGGLTGGARWWGGRLEGIENYVGAETARTLSALLERAEVEAGPRAPVTQEIEIPWQEIHVAATRVDRERFIREVPGGIVLGKRGFIDVWGGTYLGGIYEDRGLSGLVEVSNGAERVASDAWRFVHRASRKDVRSPLAAVRQAVATALELHELRQLIASTGITRYGQQPYEGAVSICEQRRGRIALTGLAWLTGLRHEGSDPTVAGCRAFVSTGELEKDLLWPELQRPEGCVAT